MSNLVREIAGVYRMGALLVIGLVDDESGEDLNSGSATPPPGS
jgi:hypothetical protein